MTFARCLAAFALALAGFAAAAATTAERSPFAQGHWWDPTRPGNGFDMFSAAGQVMVTWYTYDEGGNPTWYTAQGPASELGTTAWPLLRHRWQGGSRGEPVEAGTLKLVLRHPEAAEVAWTLGPRAGSWSIQPFVVSGVINEVDRTGSWFDPDNSGWGFALTEQGDVLGGVLFTYDAAGAPTWFAGFGRERDAAELHAFTGACPYCAPRAATNASVGRLHFTFEGDARLRIASALTVPMAPGVRVDGARLVQLSRPASMRPADRQLASFANAAALKAYLDAGMMNMRPPPAIDFSPGPAPQPFSQVNLVESGVDEAALVRTDGRFIYTYAHAANVRQPVIRIAEVGSDGVTVSPRGAVSLASGAGTPMAVAGLFLHGGQLVSVASTQPWGLFSPWLHSGGWIEGTTHVEVMSLATPALPATRWRAQIDGHLIATRRIGDRLYVVTRHVPTVQGFVFGTSYPPAVAANRARLAVTSLAMLLPSIRINGATPHNAVDASSVFVPPQGSRPPLADMVLVTSIDLRTPAVAQSLAVVGEVETVYASPTSLFLATSRYSYRTATGLPLPVEPSTYLTDIHQVRLGAAGMSIAGSASLEGLLGTDPDQLAFRMSEHEGRLRVVTSSNTWWGANRNRLTILEPSTLAPGLLRTVAWLPNDNRPEPLGKPGEFVYGTRFVGDRLYAVTFRTVDPLYVVDLSTPADPRITGAVEVPGFSEYLHPLDNGLLLGFGKDVGIDGFFQGLQLALFDVSDAGRPRELQRVLLGKRGSESALLRHHHAFSARQQADGSLAIAFPARIHDGVDQPGPTANYPWLHSGLMRFVVRGSGPADARLDTLAPLISHRPGDGFPSLLQDPGYDGGRAILFRNGTVFVGGGRFWHQSASGQTNGPF